MIKDLCLRITWSKHVVSMYKLRCVSAPVKDVPRIINILGLLKVCIYIKRGKSKDKDEKRSSPSKVFSLWDSLALNFSVWLEVPTSRAYTTYISNVKIVMGFYYNLQTHSLTYTHTHNHSFSLSISLSCNIFGRSYRCCWYKSFSTDNKYDMCRNNICRLSCHLKSWLLHRSNHLTLSFPMKLSLRYFPFLHFILLLMMTIMIIINLHTIPFTYQMQ